MYTNSAAVSLVVEDSSQVGEARRAANYLGLEAGMSEVERGNLALIVTEAGNNLVRHAEGGRIVLQTIVQKDTSTERSWVDMLALDTGPGMRSVANALRDGHSTSGTPGQGLGAIVRLSTASDVFSAPGLGTVLFSRIAAGNKPLVTGRFDLGALSLPISGEDVCGDSWAIKIDGDDPSATAQFMIADGLGHGPGANEASAAAIQFFGEARERTPAQTLELTHKGLHYTRGAAAAIASVQGNVVTYAGVGNIQSALLLSSDSSNIRGLSSFNGTVGHQAHKFANFTYDLASDALLVMASDGLMTQWRLDKYPGLLNRHPAVIAGVLYRDCFRGRDDVTVLVAKPRGTEMS